MGLKCEQMRIRKKATAWIMAVFMCAIYLGIPLLQVNAYTYAVSAEAEEIEEIKENSLFAKSAVLMDADSYRVLYGKNPSEQMAMASTTKIMTLIVTLEEGDLSETVTVSKKAASMPDVQLNMKEGEEYRLEDLLYSLMLESHNDSAVAIAEAVGGSMEGFADMMNKKAKEIGCQNTCFITPNGLDATATMTDEEGKEREVFHSTTAEDLARIMSYCITDSPCKEQFLKITQTPTYTFSNCAGTRNFTCQNHNAFLNMMDGAISGKTGFTGKAGYCYVGALERDGKTFVVALLACGWPNNKSYKWKDTRMLMEYGIANYKYVDFETVLNEVPKAGKVSVWNGQTEYIGQTAFANWELEALDKGEQSGLLLRKDEIMEVDWTVEESMQAPVEKEQIIGNAVCRIGDEILLEKKIYLTNSVEEIDFAWCLSRIWNKFYSIG